MVQEFISLITTLKSIIIRYEK